MGFKPFRETEFFEFNNLKKIAGLRHAVSTRTGGYSQGEVSGLNLSYSVDDDPQAVTANRLLLASFLQTTVDNLYFPKQTHSDQVRLVTVQTTKEELNGVDALITQTPGLAIGVMSADCVPVLIADRVNRTVAAIHAGWKGTVLGIVKKTVLKMQNDLGCNPRDMVAAIGPSISARNYEVGVDVIEAVHASFPEPEKLLIHGDKTGKALFDLWKATQYWLASAGIQKSNIETAEICTYDHSDKFYSARYFQHKTGRFAACISTVS